MFASLGNHYLIVRPGVVLTERIDSAAIALEPEFKKAQMIAFITSGLRSARDQLALIQKFCALKGVDREFPTISTATLYGKTIYEGQEVYGWQGAWSRLLNIGVIINPPLSAIALFDYTRNGVNKKGRVIGASPHRLGHCFDVGGGSGGAEDEYRVLQGSVGRIPGIKAVLLERENNAVHCDC